MQESQTEFVDGDLYPVPEGLRELMSDITREVLRAQPRNVYAFIASYLSALLEVRSNVTIAGQLCKDIHHCSRQPELDDELRNIGLLEEELRTAEQLIETFLEKDGGKETSLLLQIMKSTSIEEAQGGAIRDAVRTACQEHRLYQCGVNRNASAAVEQKCTDNVSSVSLAGSFINLPKHMPYSVHNDTLSDISERTCDTQPIHTYQHRDDSYCNSHIQRDFNPSRSNSLNTIYQRDGQDKENVIRFKTDLVKFISHEELPGGFIDNKKVEFNKESMYLADSRSVSSSDDL